MVWAQELGSKDASSGNGGIEQRRGSQIRTHPKAVEIDRIEGLNHPQLAALSHMPGRVQFAIAHSMHQESDLVTNAPRDCGRFVKSALIILIASAQPKCGLATERPAAMPTFRLPSVVPRRGLEVEGQMQITTAVKVADSQEKTSWEEPSLFPQEAPQQSNDGLENQKPRSLTRKSGTSLSAPTTEPFESGQKYSSDAFQTEFGSLGISGPSPVGLASTRERDATLARIRDKESTEPYNIKIGRLPLRMAASVDAEFTDNSERTGHNPQADLMLIPRLDITGSVKLGSTTTLTIGLGFGYIKYLVRTENDRLLALASLNPDNGISLDVKIGKFLISAYDKPVVPQFQAEAVTQRGQSQYNQFTNTAGINILWNVNSHASMSMRYDHLDRISLTSAENTSAGSTDSFLASLSCNLGQSLGVGIEAGADVSKSTSGVLNDGTTYHLGPVVNYELSQYLRLQASFGYQGGRYGTSGTVMDSSTLGTYYANVSLANSLNSNFSHSLSFGQESQRGSFSNFSVSKYVRYQATWHLIRGVMLGASASFQDIDESGGLFAEHFRNISFGIYSGLNVTTHISLSLAYNYTRRYASGQLIQQESSLDFDENRLTLHLGYAF